MWLSKYGDLKARGGARAVVERPSPGRVRLRLSGRLDSSTTGSVWAPTRTVTFANIEAVDPALFILWARTPGGNVTVDTVAFTVMDASILYIDDYQWFDAAGNVDAVNTQFL